MRAISKDLTKIRTFPSLSWTKEVGLLSFTRILSMKIIALYYINKIINGETNMMWIDKESGLDKLLV